MVLPIRVEEYFAMTLEQRNAELAEWRAGGARLYTQNTVFVDMDGVSLIWYLPDLLGDDLKVSFFQ